MKLKHKLNAVLFFSLLSSLTIPSVSFSGTWFKNNGNWYYNENDKKLTNWQNINNNYYYFDNDGKMYTGWLKDKDNSFYFLENEKNGNEGILSSGWKLIDSNWYFFSNKHDGYFGKMLTGWHWIDSKCYFFDINGKMLLNTKTPDGYDVNFDGAWTINGKIQIGNSEYTTKIISTNTEISKIASSRGGFSGSSSGGGGSSSGGGGGGGGGGSSYNSTPTKKTYTYTIKYINSNGIIIKKIDGKKEEGSVISIDRTEIDGYTFETEDSFILNQNTEKIINLKEKTPKRKTLYKVKFLSRDGKREILNEINGEGNVDEDVPIYFQRFVNLSDGTKWMAIDNSPRSFKLTSLTNNNFDIYYINVGNMEKEKIPTMSYTIKYIANDTGATLAVATGYAKKNEIIPYRNNILYYGFEDSDSSNKYLKISDNPDDNTIEVKMKRISFPGPIKDERTGKYKG